MQRASIRVSWDVLARFNVCVRRDLTVRFEDVIPGRFLSFATRAWIDMDAAAFYVVEPDDVGDPGSGAYAVASAFASDTRRIAHDWLAAWGAAKAGHRAEAIKTAASVEAEQKRARAEREAAASAAFQRLSEESERRRQKRSTTKLGGGDRQPSSRCWRSRGASYHESARPARTATDDVGAVRRRPRCKSTHFPIHTPGLARDRRNTVNPHEFVEGNCR